LRHPSAPFSVGLSLGLAITVLVFASFILPSVPALSREPDKTLKLFFAHTGERGEFTFKRNGQYDRGELGRLNHFLRDWRKGEDAHMDPHLLDLVWSIYQESGSKDYIHVVSAYRSPETNEMLRRRSSGVAKNSQHRLGKAMDWFVTDVKLADLRAVAMKMQGGGVGYYPTSGSPFVHTDTGNVRAWPRMSRQQLLALFPNGNTLHIPADGKPLPGYEQAVAARRAQGGTALAYLETDSGDDEGSSATAATATADRTGTDAGTRSWLARVFPGDKADDTATAAVSAPADAAPVLASAEADALDARMPRPRPGSEADAAEAPQPLVLASADPTAAGFVMGALSRGVPSAEAYGIGARPAPPAGAGDAIATLLSTDEGAPAAPKPSQLAYVPSAPAPGPLSAADSAIIAAFTAVDQSGVVSEADAALIAALTRQTADDGALDGEQASSGLVFAAADLAAYQDDEDALLDMIDAAQPADPRIAKLAMPRPQKEEALFVAPGAASEVADLRGTAGPPVDRFATASAAAPKKEEGFFTKLFASLIE